MKNLNRCLSDTDQIDTPIKRLLRTCIFSDFQRDLPDNEWIASWLDDPLLDVGAGAGRHALYFQEQFPTVAIEKSEHLVRTMRDRGVEDARTINMFDVKSEFDPHQFDSVLMIGTQLGLKASRLAD